MAGTRCPICDLELGFESWSDGGGSQEICPSCGVQFGYTDAAGGSAAQRVQLYELWRTQWLANGKTPLTDAQAKEAIARSTQQQ